MVLPFVLDASAPVSAASMAHTTYVLLSGHTTPAAATLAIGAHALSYFTVMTTAAWVVYRKVGLVERRS
jgi:hypothetical protein